MNPLFRHFALVLVAVTAINAALASRRVPAFFADASARADASRFIWQSAGWLIALFSLLEILTVASGASSPLCYLPFPGAVGARRYIAWSLWVAWIGGVTLWVLIGGGAERVGRFGPVFARATKPEQVYNPRTIRLLAIAWCLGSLLIPLVFPSNKPVPLDCPGSTISVRAI
jgi:hypothetical protein